MLMNSRLRWTLAIMVGVLAGVDSGSSIATQAQGAERRILQRQDLAGVPGDEVLLVEATIPVGGREGRHTHPGTMIGYVTQGTITFDIGVTSTVYGPGASVILGPGTVHEGINRGKTPIKTLVTFIVEKGKPLRTAAE